MRTWRAGKGTRWEAAGHGGHPPLAKHKAELGSGGPGGHHSLAFPPSRWQRDGTQAQSKEGRGTQVLGQRFGKGWFDWIWLGERGGISDEAALGEPLTLVLDHSAQIHTSIRQSWHDAGLGSSAPPTWGVQGEMGWRLRAQEVERSPPTSPFPQARKVEDTSKAAPAPIPAWPEARNTGLPRGGCGPGPG